MTTNVYQDDNLADAVETAPTGETVIVKPGDHYTERPDIEFGEGLELYIEDGAVIYAGFSHDKHDHMFDILGVDNCSVTGPGIIDGNRSNFDHADSQFEHMIYIDGTDNFLLDGPTLQNAPGGDCLVLHNTYNSTFRNFTADRGYRNCIALHNGRSLLFRDFKASGAFGRAPRIGMDIEPSARHDGDDLADIRIHNARFTNNGQSGFQIHTLNLTTDSVVEIDITNCVFADNGKHGVNMGRALHLDLVRFESCISEHNDERGYSLGGKNVYVWDSVAKDNANADTEMGILAISGYPDPVVADVAMKGCEAVDTRSSPEQTHPAQAITDSELTLLDFEYSGNQTDAIDVADGGEVIYENVSGPDGDASFTGGGTVTHASEKPEEKDFPPRPETLDGGSDDDGNTSRSEPSGEGLTTNHGYQIPEKGENDWHIPLNDNFDAIDTDIPIADADGAKSEYKPIDRSLYIAIDTATLYVGDGTQWNELGTLN